MSEISPSSAAAARGEAHVGPPLGAPGYRWLRRLEPARPMRVRESRHAERLILATVCLGAFMGQLDASIITVGLPRLARDLHAGVGAVEWGSLSYLLTLVALVAPAGSWSDAVGRKALYLAGFGVFTAASLGCAAAPNLTVLCALRVVQAAGAALLQANSVALIAANTPRARLGRAIGVQAAAQAIGLALGPSLGGLLLTVGSWRLLFLVNAPVGIIAIGTGMLLLPRSRDLAPPRAFDRTGLALFLPAVCLPLLALSLAADSGGLPSAVVAAGAFAVAVVAVAVVALVRHQRRAQSPLLDVGLLRTPRFRTGLVTALAGYVVLFGVLFVIPFALSTGHLASPGQVGLELTAMPVGIGLIAPVAGRLADRAPVRVMGGGLLLAAVALGELAVLRPQGAALAGTLFGVGVGLGAFTAANNATTVGVAPRTSAGAASGLLNMTRGIGTAAGTALAALTFAVAAGRHEPISSAAALTGLSAVAGTLAVVAALAAVLTVASGRT